MTFSVEFDRIHLMNEIILMDPGPCGEAILAFLEKCGLTPVIKSGFDDLKEAIVFYMDENQWKAFQGKFREELRKISGILGSPSPNIRTVRLDPSDWREAWKRYAKIYRFGRELVVKPGWRVLRSPPPCPVISIDPQRAFGTGGHASTRLCLRQLIRIRNVAPDRLHDVLDVGTGSGILAIAAAFFGAKHVLAVDVDREALAVARENAEKNHVAALIEFRAGSVTEIRDRFDLILANINEAVLRDLLQEFVRRLRDTGILVVSGILREQGRGFLEAAARAGLRRHSRRVEGEWVSYALTLRDPPS